MGLRIAVEKAGRVAAMTPSRARQRIRVWAAAVLLLASFAAAAQSAPQSAAQALARREGELAVALQESPFRRPLHIESSESGDAARGDVYARLPHPFALIASALARPAQWCDVLILHLNVKHCVAGTGELTLYLGSKHEQPLLQAFRLQLRQETVVSGPDYLQVQMLAGTGPLGTRDYRITLEAIPSGDGLSFMHFRYGVSYGLVARLAMKGYMSTVGREKIGFSVVKDEASGTTRPIDGPRAAVERNAMRYALAIAVYLDSLGLPPATGVEERLTDWFDATEQYAAQLHEIERAEYLAMKRHELARAAPEAVEPAGR